MTLRGLIEAVPFNAVDGQFFRSHQEWVCKASSWLTQHPRYRNTENAKGKGWQGEHFTALCFDQKGRRCRNGGDMQRAHDEGAFPVWWVWPDQIAELIMASQKADAILRALEGGAGMGSDVPYRQKSGCYD